VLEQKAVYSPPSAKAAISKLKMRVKTSPPATFAADRNYTKNLPIGYSPVDKRSTRPVRQGKLSVEPRALGPDDDSRKAMLEVWTERRINSRRAIGLAAKLVKDHMSLFPNHFEEAIESMKPPYGDANEPAAWEHSGTAGGRAGTFPFVPTNCLKKRQHPRPSANSVQNRAKNEMLKRKTFGRNRQNENQGIYW